MISTLRERVEIPKVEDSPRYKYIYTNTNTQIQIHKYPKLRTVHGFSSTAFTTLLALQLPGPPRIQTRGGSGRDWGRLMSEVKEQSSFEISLFILRQSLYHWIDDDDGGGPFVERQILSFPPRLFDSHLLCHRPCKTIIFQNILSMISKYCHQTWIPCRIQQTLWVFCWFPKDDHLSVWLLFKQENLIFCCHVNGFYVHCQNDEAGQLDMFLAVNVHLARYWAS